MQPEEMQRVRARAEAAGLTLDEARLKALAEALAGLEAMMEPVRTVPVDPVDLAMAPYDPAWPEERGR